MPDKKTKDDAPEQAASEATTPKKKRGWRRFFTKKRVITIIVLSVALHGVGYLFFTLQRAGALSSRNPEYSLGKFEFQAPHGQKEGVQKASFNLHLSLLVELQHVGKIRLDDRKFKVQQEVEQLLREAASGDFEDPKLTELKRQLQETINQVAGKRVIAEVIITDLSIHRVDAAVVSSRALASQPSNLSNANGSSAVGWREKESE